MRVCFIVLSISVLLTGCQGGLKVLSAEHGETLSLSYEDEGNRRLVKGVSKTGESFSGKLLWGGDINVQNHGQYQGKIIGDKGRTFNVVLECDRSQQRCTGIAKDNSGDLYYVF